MTSYRFNNGQRTLSAVSTFLILMTIFYSQLSYAVVGGDWENVSGITVEKSSRAYDRSKREYYTINTVENQSGEDIQGPLE